MPFIKTEKNLTLLKKDCPKSISFFMPTKTLLLLSYKVKTRIERLSMSMCFGVDFTQVGNFLFHNIVQSFFCETFGVGSY